MYRARIRIISNSRVISYSMLINTSDCRCHDGWRGVARISSAEKSINAVVILETTDGSKLRRRMWSVKNNWLGFQSKSGSRRFVRESTTSRRTLLCCRLRPRCRGSRSIASFLLASEIRYLVARKRSDARHSINGKPASALKFWFSHGGTLFQQERTRNILYTNSSVKLFPS